MNLLPLLTAGTEGGIAGGGISMIVIYGALFAFMWFVLIRPQRKRQKETESLQSAVKTGDSVLLHSGIYGKVVDTVNDCLIVELGTNKSVRVPVLRSGVASISEPDLSIVKDDEDDEA